MKIRAKEGIKDLEGNDIKAPDGIFTIGNALSNILINSKTGGQMKMFVLAQKFHNDEVLDLDDADIALIKGAVEKTEQYNNLVNGQLLLLLEKKEETKSK